jgi:hypothetical protein
VMGTSTCTRRSGGHHMKVTFSMTSETAFMWINLGCRLQGSARSASRQQYRGARSPLKRSMGILELVHAARKLTSTGYR